MELFIAASAITVAATGFIWSVSYFINRLLIANVNRSQAHTAQPTHQRTNRLTITTDANDEPRIEVNHYPLPAEYNNISANKNAHDALHDTLHGAFHKAFDTAQQHLTNTMYELALHHALLADMWFATADTAEDINAHIAYNQNRLIIAQALLQPERTNAKLLINTPDAIRLTIRLAQRYLKTAINGFMHIRTHSPYQLKSDLCKAYLILAQSYPQNQSEPLTAAQRAIQQAAQWAKLDMADNNTSEQLDLHNQVTLFFIKLFEVQHDIGSNTGRNPDRNTTPNTDQVYQHCIKTLEFTYPYLLTQGVEQHSYPPETLHCYERMLATLQRLSKETSRYQLPAIPGEHINEAMYLVHLAEQEQHTNSQTARQHNLAALEKFDQALQHRQLKTADACQCYLTTFSQHLNNLNIGEINNRSDRPLLPQLKRLYQYIDTRKFPIDLDTSKQITANPTTDTITTITSITYRWSQTGILDNDNAFYAVQLIYSASNSWDTQTKPINLSWLTPKKITEAHTNQALTVFNNALKQGLLNTSALCTAYLIVFSQHFNIASSPFPQDTNKKPFKNLYALYQHIDQKGFKVNIKTNNVIHATYLSFCLDTWTEDQPRNNQKNNEPNNKQKQAKNRYQLHDEGLDLWAELSTSQPAAVPQYAQMIYTFLRRYPNQQHTIIRHIELLVTLYIPAIQKLNSHETQKLCTEIYHLMLKTQDYDNDKHRQSTRLTLQPIVNLFAAQFAKQPAYYAPYYARAYCILNLDNQPISIKNFPHIERSAEILNQGYLAASNTGKTIDNNLNTVYLSSWQHLAEKTTAYIYMQRKRPTWIWLRKKERQLYQQVQEKLNEAAQRCSDTNKAH